MPETYDLIVAGGEVVNHAGRGLADVGVRGGKITGAKRGPFVKDRPKIPGILSLRRPCPLERLLALWVRPPVGGPMQTSRGGEQRSSPSRDRGAAN